MEGINPAFEVIVTYFSKRIVGWVKLIFVFSFFFFFFLCSPSSSKKTWSRSLSVMVSLKIKISLWILESSYILTSRIFKATYEHNHFTIEPFSLPSAVMDYVVFFPRFH